MADKTKAGHTPGPWTVKRHVDSVTGEPYKTLYESHIAVEPDVCAVWAPPQNAEREANARLIAAAPAMLEALRRIVGYMDAHSGRVSVVRHFAAEAIKEATDEVV